MALQSELVPAIKSTKPAGYLHKAFCGLIALWLSGVLFIPLCSGDRSSDSMEFCPLAKLGAHCDKVKRSEDVRSITYEDDGQGIDCCAFIPTVFEKTRDINASLEVASVASSFIVETIHNGSLHRTKFSTAPYRSPLLLKDRTFLTNRAIRI
jgi:hypothetical protein